MKWFSKRCWRYTVITNLPNSNVGTTISNNIEFATKEAFNVVNEFFLDGKGSAPGPVDIKSPSQMTKAGLDLMKTINSSMDTGNINNQHQTNVKSNEK